MFIAYIAFGITSGLIAAIVAVLSGAGPLAAFFAYSAAGLIGIIGGLVWARVPKQGLEIRNSAAQRS
jgi:hypothetical protein